MRPPLTLPRELAVRVLTGYVPLNEARSLATYGGTALALDSGQVLSVETSSGKVTIR